MQALNGPGEIESKRVKFAEKSIQKLIVPFSPSLSFPRWRVAIWTITASSSLSVTVCRVRTSALR